MKSDEQRPFADLVHSPIFLQFDSRGNGNLLYRWEHRPVLKDVNMARRKKSATYDLDWSDFVVI
jgi:hypothetical protein